jgi:NADH-quinone oxidoreductase subunit M
LLAGLGIILGAAYMLYLYRRVIFGQMTKEDIKDFTDLSPREMAVFAPLLVVMLWMGIYPSSFLDMMHVSVEHLIRNYEMALAVGEPITIAGW